MIATSGQLCAVWRASLNPSIGSGISTSVKSTVELAAVLRKVLNGLFGVHGCDDLEPSLLRDRGRVAEDGRVVVVDQGPG